MKFLDDSEARAVPVVYIFYNRPAVMAQTWEAIRQWRPEKLFLVADGPRATREGDQVRCESARQIVKDIDWSCEVRCLYSEANLGCRQRITSGLGAVFSEEDRAIIVEDDCLVHEDFFRFCATLLDRYLADERFWGISGTSYLYGWSGERRGYFATRYASSWGWATWRRAWQKADFHMEFWPEWQTTSRWCRAIPDGKERWYWHLLFDDCYKRRIDSWAIPFLANQWYRDGVFLMSSRNLVSNLGFGTHGTHTRDADGFGAAQELEGVRELSHPGRLTPDPDREAEIFEMVFGGNRLRFPHSLYHVPRLMMGRYYRWLRAVR